MPEIKWIVCTACCWIFTAAADSKAAEVYVNSIAQLQTAINNASAGDRIIVANGTYATSAQITVNRIGTAAKPIVIEAATVGGAEITGSYGFALNSPSAHVHIQGFKFTHISGRNSINSGAVFCRFTRNIFECSGDGNYLLVAGDDAQIDRNEFRNKSTVGNMIDVRGTG
ncbi:MAG TPA: chondroitinase-B domain-containing protein, partial [Anaerohalosphaeraceae bacterium]|nr:chondroitinase-B domain-containing protein [Anaerohalosphaeraceae bacterium]